MSDATITEPAAVVESTETPAASRKTVADPAIVERVTEMRVAGASKSRVMKVLFLDGVKRSQIAASLTAYETTHPQGTGKPTIYQFVYNVTKGLQNKDGVKATKSEREAAGIK